MQLQGIESQSYQLRNKKNTALCSARNSWLHALETLTRRNRCFTKKKNPKGSIQVPPLHMYVASWS